MAVVLRLCDEDRAKFGGPEEVTFDEKVLDDLPWTQLHEFETEMDVTLDYLLAVDRVARTERWKAARVWMAWKLAGEKVPPFKDFTIRTRRVVVTEAAEGGDAVPPSSVRSSAAARSRKR